jgi:hypothetical protein
MCSIAQKRVVLWKWGGGDEKISDLDMGIAMIYFKGRVFENVFANLRFK